MKPRKRSLALIAGAIAATAAVAAPGGHAQGSGATTLSFYEPDAQSTFKVLDTPPRTFGKRPGPKSRFSVGDKITATSTLLDKKGGTRQGTFYAEGTIVKAGTFATAKVLSTGSYVLKDGSQISAQGTFSFSKDSTVPVVGGTGRFEGVRGHLTSTGTPHASIDTLTLRP